MFNIDRRPIRSARSGSPWILVALCAAPHLALTPFASRARADVLPNYAIVDVPDFDQKRDASLNPLRYGLPQNDPSTCSADPCKSCAADDDCNSCNTTCGGVNIQVPECCKDDPHCVEAFDGPCIGVGGGMYCFPTSAIDWMAYLANHGYPQVDPGPAADWQSMDVYNLIGQKIFEMGELMNTSPGGGTGGEDGRNGIEQWLAPYAPLFSVIRIAKQGPFSPRLEHLAKAGLSGQLVIAGVGYYAKFIPPPQTSLRAAGMDTWVRDGGHLMAFNGATFAGNPLVRTLSCRNPGSGGNSTLDQSGFVPMTTTMTAVTAVFRAEPEDFFVRTHDRLDAWTGSKTTFLDSYTAIVPFKLLTATPVGDPPGTKLLNPVPVPPTNIPASTTIPSPTGTALVDGAFFPSFTDALIITAGNATSPNRLWEVDLVTEDAVEIVLPDEPGLIVTQRSPFRANAVNRSRTRGFYIVDRTVSVDIPLPSTTLADAIAYDDANDQVYVLSTSSNELLQYPADLSTSPIIHALPAVIAPTGSVDMAVSGDGSEIWIADAAGGTIYGLTFGAGGGLFVSESIACCASFLPGAATATSSLPDNDKPEKIVITTNPGFNSGASGFRFLILLDSDPPTGEGPLMELERDAAGGWQLAGNPLLGGMTATGFIDAVRSRTNFDPATMTGPAWRNVLPTDDFGEGPTIPAVSTWGILALALLTLTAGAIVATRQRTSPTTAARAVGEASSCSIR